MHKLSINNYLSLIHPVNHFGPLRYNRVGQNRMNTPYMTAYLVNSLPKIPYIHRIYMVLANPTHVQQ